MLRITLLSVIVVSLTRSEDDFCLNDACQPEFPVDESLNALEQDDPRLIEAIRERFLIQPSKDKPYNLSTKTPNMAGETQSWPSFSLNKLSLRSIRPTTACRGDDEEQA